jgi:hypothetical protein
VLRTLRFLNAAMKAARFSAVELIRFTGDQHGAFEARFVAAAEPAKGAAGAGKTALAGVDELLATVTDDGYRHHHQDLFDGLADVDGLTVFWGTTGCSVRMAVPDRSPLSVAGRAAQAGRPGAAAGQTGMPRDSSRIRCPVRHSRSPMRASLAGSTGPPTSGTHSKDSVALEQNKLNGVAHRRH